MRKSRLTDFIKRFTSIDLDEQKDFSIVIKPAHILSVAHSEEGKQNELVWHFKNGILKKARTVKVLNDTYIVVEERRLLRVRACLININEIASVSFSNL